MRSHKWRLLALGALPLIIASCAGGVSGEGTQFWDVVLWMLWFFLLVIWFWLLITIFADIFRRDDISGWGKAGWTVLIIFLPFLGILIYLIARPRMTEQDQRMMEEAEAQQRRLEGYSSADEIAKLKRLHNEGAISDAEYEEMKRKAM